jgi:hypothetical protein
MTEPEIAAEGVLVLRTHSDDSADAPSSHSANERIIDKLRWSLFRRKPGPTCPPLGIFSKRQRYTNASFYPSSRRGGPRLSPGKPVKGYRANSFTRLKAGIYFGGRHRLSPVKRVNQSER